MGAAALLGGVGACSAGSPDSIGGPGSGTGASGGATVSANGGSGNEVVFGSTGGDSTLGGFAGSSGAPGVDGGNCGSVSINSSVEEVVVPGNVLIVFDQSDSMTAADFNGQVRWKAASDALVAAIAPQKDSLTVGAVFFPSVDAFNTLLGGTCDLASVSPITDTTSADPQIPFMPGAQFIDAWVKHWAAGPLRLGTPTEAGLIRGDQALGAANLKGNIVVILVTDGQPTCGSLQSTTGLAAKWKGLGIPTYVIGLPGAGSAGAPVPDLSGIAAAGGTTDYVMPSDGAKLQQLFSNITSKIVSRSLNSCDIKFGQPPSDLKQVALVVTDAKTGQKFAVNQGPDGWQLAADGSKATLQGATCKDATNGTFSTVSFAFGCVKLPLLR